MSTAESVNRPELLSRKYWSTKIIGLLREHIVFHNSDGQLS